MISNSVRKRVILRTPRSPRQTVPGLTWFIADSLGPSASFVDELLARHVLDQRSEGGMMTWRPFVDFLNGLVVVAVVEWSVDIVEKR